LGTEADAQDIDALVSIARDANIEIPGQISALFEKKISQKALIDKKEIEQEVLTSF
jgi:hypothetical protein